MNTIDANGEVNTMKSIIMRTISNFEDDQIAIVGDCGFGGCKSLTSVILPNATKIGKSAFSGCTKLTNVSIPSVTLIASSAFEGSQSYVIPITSIDLPSATIIGDRAFYCCLKLESISMPNVVNIHSRVFYRTLIKHLDLPFAKTFGEYVFGESTSYRSVLQTINVPNLESAGQYAFAYTNLASIVLPKIKNVTRYLFDYDSLLTKVDLHSVEDIQQFAFRNCNKIDKLIIRTPGKIVNFASNANLNANAIVYVPDDLVDSYKEATNWSAIADRIKPLSELPPEEEES